jgi:hypothetical protein
LTGGWRTMVVIGVWQYLISKLSFEELLLEDYEKQDRFKP